MRNDVSRPLPHKRYATKAGPAYVMNVTLRGAYRQFVLEHPGAKIGYTLFCRLRPRNVKKLGSVAADTCLCMYCLNVRYKLDALNRVLSREGVGQQLPSETRVLDLICCAKQDGSRWHQPDCISGTCLECGDSITPIREICSSVLDKPVSWMCWARTSDLGSFKVDVFALKGSVSDLLKELKENLDNPIKAVTFKRHLFTAFWQYRQYRELKNTLLEDEALMVMDLAENRKASYNAEVKAAHFGKKQITLHPIVLYFRTPEGHLARHSLIYLSDDITHDYHLVNHFTLAALDYVKAFLSLRRVYLFSDGCAAQYKGRGTFADLSLISGLNVQRLYYGSEHGKGEADGETGVLSQMLARAVQGGQVNISNAKDLFEWARETMSKDTPTLVRRFFFVNREDVERQRPETDVATVPGTRQFHQVEHVTDYVIRCRKLACFCSRCRLNKLSCCVNKEYVGDYQTFKLRNNTPGVLDTAFVDADDTAETTVTPLVTPVPQVGDYLLLTHSVGRRSLDYVAVVTSASGDGDLTVSYMRSSGGHHTFPDVKDEWQLSLTDPNLVAWKRLDPPSMDNCGRYSFSL